MGILEAIILGIIQGLTEFLPVSSSGHIELGKVLLNVHPKDPLLFSIVVHAATAMSTIVVYWRDILHILRDLLKFQWNSSTRFAAMILVSMIPVGIVGILFEKEVEVLFEGKVLLVGAMLWVTALLLWLSTRSHHREGEVTFWRALGTGIAQAIAILPGISRSGATISTALILGVKRSEAARFSFLMVLPPILGATALKLKDYLEMAGADALPAEGAPESVGPTALIVGFLAAFIAGLIACKWMIALVRQAKLQYFALYCFLVGAIAMAYGLFFM